jgi:hypothetical protein
VDAGRRPVAVDEGDPGFVDFAIPNGCEKNVKLELGKLDLTAIS